MRRGNVPSGDDGCGERALLERKFLIWPATLGPRNEGVDARKQNETHNVFQNREPALRNRWRREGVVDVEPFAEKGSMIHNELGRHGQREFTGKQPGRGWAITYVQLR